MYAQLGDDAKLSEVTRRLDVVEMGILSYGYNDVVSFQRVELGVKAPPEPETYDMDRFITDELRRKEARETMLLHFSAADPDNYLNLDLMSFLVTKVQKLFPEYVCVGILDA